MNKRITLVLALAFLPLFVASLVSIADAASKDDIVFPVEELGGCTSEEECRSYCDNPDNFRACFAFAKKHNLVEGPIAEQKEEDLDKFASAMKEGGPGGCTSHVSCEAYCNNVQNLDECIEFAERHGFIDNEDLDEAKKIRSAIKRGVQIPAGCTNKEACEEYCMNPDNMEECLAFAEEAGFMDKGELETAKRAMELMRNGETPGGCRTQRECEAYCFEGENIEECMEFGLKMGLMNEEEASQARKMLTFMKEGKMPGGCRTKEQCEAYCNDENNVEECFRFAEEAGFISDEDKARMKEGLQEFSRGLEQAPPEVIECLKQSIGEAEFNRLLNGEGFPTPQLGEKMEACFQSFQPGPEGFGDHEGGFSGPGGCQTEEECMAYCKENPEECRGFGPGSNESGAQREGGGFESSGPGGCSTQEECRAYCEANPQDCGGYGNSEERGGREDEAARVCAEQGGYWQEGQCVFPKREEYQRQYEEQSQQYYDEQHQEEYDQQYQDQQYQDQQYQDYQSEER
ncbi:MAG: hypothetical protein HYS87_01130 [Candidatus Colwellbacteria bacterium]|nr:hypothetical protein [Candidatus Colwellbacteria bacterium]